nr:hypothetical protein [Tanacetum cinerariifolium]
MAEIQDVHMFKRKSLRVPMFRMMLGTHRELFKLRLQDLLQIYNATIVVRNFITRNCSKPRVRDSKYFMEHMLVAKHDEAGVTLTDKQNDFLVADSTRMEDIEELSVNICLMARIQPANINSDAGPSYDSAFLSEVQRPSTSYVNTLFAKDNQKQKYPKQPKIINNTIGGDQIDSNIIFNEPNVDVNSGSVEYDNNVQASYALEKLALNAYKEAEKQQINATKMSEKEDKYHDTVLDLEAKAKENENVVLKIDRSLQGILMLGAKPMSFYDLNVKHGLGYENPYTLKKAISHNPKLYDASCFDDTKIYVNIKDTEDILDDATKCQIKIENKLKDPIAIEKKQNIRTIDYNKLNSLYEDFVPQKELSAEQKYFSSTFIPFKNYANASTSTSLSKTKPYVTSMPSPNPMKLYLDKMENEFTTLFALIQANSKRKSIFYSTLEEKTVN